MATRDIEAARAAAAAGDTEASRRAHHTSAAEIELVVADDQGGDGAGAAVMNAGAGAATGEVHGSGGDFVKSLVFGGLARHDSAEDLSRLNALLSQPWAGFSFPRIALRFP